MNNMNSNVNQKDFKDFFNKLASHKVNILLTGATGAGKSSTINALFNKELAKVGTSPDPETMDIQKFSFKNMTLWDTPGLGDGRDNDIRHAKNIINKLTEKDFDGNLLIDLVIVILDGSTRDLGTSYELINNIIIPNLGKNPEKRLLIAINQADRALRTPNGWDYKNNRPTPQAEKFLDEKVRSVKKRIKEATGVDVDPIYYCAGFKEYGCSQKPYNLVKFMYYIMSMLPKEKRVITSLYANQNPEMWEYDEDLKKHQDGIMQELLNAVNNIAQGVAAGAAIGAAIGSIIPFGGTIVGAAVGGIVGAGIKIVKKFFSW
jgi:predicted GTPase